MLAPLVYAGGVVFVSMGREHMGKVYGQWPVKLKLGITDDEVEQFARTLIGQMPPLPGVRFALLKSNRGEHVGRYQFLIEIDSLEVRDRLVPDTGPSEEM